MCADRPKNFTTLWAQNGLRTSLLNPNDLPEEDLEARFLQEIGFPEITMRSVLKGGLPPFGGDFNELFYQISDNLRWFQAGGNAIYDPELSASMGGYSFGAIVATVEQNTWVYWISLENGNTEDPRQLKVNEAAAQGKWRRYPVIEAKDGSTLRYNDAGEISIFTATSQYQLYVSWSKGQDWNKEFDGSRVKPFKTIDRALSAAPDIGNITIYILDTDMHPWIGMYDYDVNTGVSHLENLPGILHSESEQLTEMPKTFASGAVSIGSKNVRIAPYHDAEKDINDQWFNLVNDVQAAANDGSWAYCVEQSDLDRFGLKRPKILLCWEYGSTKPNKYWYSTFIKWVGLARGTNAGSIRFDGVDFYINQLEKLNATDLGNNIGWVQPSYDTTFVGCKVVNQCRTGLSFMFGGTGNPECRITFDGANQFLYLDELNAGTNLNNGYDIKDMKTIQASGLFYITSSFDGSGGWYLESLDLHFMKSNIEEYFAHKSVFKDPSLNVIYLPFKRYAFMNSTFPIDKD